MRHARPYKTILQNAGENGITAGSTHFDDVWARDALYASWGLIEREEYEPVRRTLDTLARYQKDGQIPLRVGRKSMLLAYLKLPSPKGPRYDTDKGKSPALDPNTLFVLTVCRLAHKTKDYDTFKRYRAAMKRALDWLRTQEEDDLLVEGWYASWDDALRKEGASVYNNALYYAALLEAAELLHDDALRKKARRVRRGALHRLWNDAGYYDAWEGMPVMDVAGNLLAVWSGLASKKRSKRILASLDAFKETHDDTLPRTNYPAYPDEATSRVLKLIGLADYHNFGPYWLWIAALELLVKQQRGDAKHLESAIWETVHESCGYYELYETPGVPLRRTIYRSEKDFSWACGLLELTVR